MRSSRLSWLVFGTCLALTSCGPPEEAQRDRESAALSEIGALERAVTCSPLMSIFPVAAAHNIGYDTSCRTGTCAISCPDSRANSDYGGDHHGIDVFAFHRAPLVATTNGTITAVGTVSATSGIRVRLRDACGWEYYYGHLDQAVVSAGQRVNAGQLIGYMGRTGAASTHLHFNVSPDGNYSSDINPIGLLTATSATACGAPPPPPSPGCGALQSGEALSAGQHKASCDGRFALVMQGDGNLVLYQSGRVLWHTATNGRGGQTAVMQPDGNFVVYSGGGVALWSSGTSGRVGSWLAVQDDGNLVVYQGGTPRWSSSTCCH